MTNNLQLSMLCDLDLWTPKYIGHILNSWGVFVWSFMIIKLIMQHKPFSVISALWPWLLCWKINRAHPRLLGSLCMKFRDDRCKGKAIMRRDYFTKPCHFWLSMHCDLDLWPLNPKIAGAHPRLIRSLYVKLHDDRCKGKAVMRLNNFT